MPPLPLLPLPPSHPLPRHLGVLVLCWGVLTGCLSSRPISQGVVRIETGCPRVPASRHCDHERRLPPSPTAHRPALVLRLTLCWCGPWVGGCPPFISYVLPQCVRVRCGVWCVCGWASPEYAAVAQCPRVRAPSAVHQRLREFTLRSPIGSFGSRLSICPCAGGRRGSLHVLSPIPPTPHPAPSPHWWVCVWSRV